MTQPDLEQSIFISQSPTFDNRESVQPKKRRWASMIVGNDELEKSIKDKTFKVFSGGVCNIVNEEGDKVRSEERDEINQGLDDADIGFVDPQIDLQSHGRDYVSEQDGPVEKKAIQASRNDLIVFSRYSAGAVSALEIFNDILKGEKRKNKRVVLLNDFNTENVLKFQPMGLSVEKGRRAHYGEYQKSANLMRRELISMLSENDGQSNCQFFMDHNVEGDQSRAVTEASEKNSKARVVVISSKRAHYDKMLQVMSRLSEGESVIVYFRGTDKNSSGLPIVNFPKYPEFKEGVENTERASLLMRRYIGEVNRMRKQLKKSLDRTDPDTTLVATQKKALEVLLKNIEQQRLEETDEQERLIAAVEVFTQASITGSARSSTNQ